MADGKRYVQNHYVNTAGAVDTLNGLIVPVIKDADKKSILQVAKKSSTSPNAVSMAR